MPRGGAPWQGLPRPVARRRALRLVSTGQGLGSAVAAHDVADLAAFTVCLRVPDHPLREVLLFLWAVRQRTRDRHPWPELVAALRRTPVPRWLVLLVRQAYGLYVLLRYRANPALPTPLTEMEGGLYLPRRAALALRRLGLSPVVAHARRAVEERAAAQMQRLWASMAGVSCVVWFDNYYRPRHVYNPAAAGGTLNCTVMAVLHVPRLPAPMQMLPVSQWDAQRSAVAGQLRVYWRDMLAQVTGLVRLRETGQLEVRAPLDRRRRHVQSLQWTPLSLNVHVVGSTVGLVEVLGLCRTLRDHTRTPMPLLVDVDLYQRLLKLAYGRETQRYPVRELLASMPPLFGVWHAYKYVCLVTHRVFLPVFTYWQRGTVAPGQAVPTFAALRRVELLLAAAMMLPRPDTHRLVQAAEAAKSQWRRLAQLRSQRVLAIQQGGAVAGLVGGGARPRRRPSALEVRRAKDRMLALEALRQVVMEFAPACLLLGCYVRECHWAGRGPASAWKARVALQLATLLLVKLTEGGEHRVQYIRCLLAALCQWSSWHEGCVAAAFSEEVNEAALSRLGHTLNLHPAALTSEEANLHYLLVQPGARGYRDTTAHNVRPQFFAQMRRLIRECCEYQTNLVSWTPWSAASNTAAEEHWPEDCWLPEGLRACPSRGRLEDLILHTQRLLPQQGPIDHVVDATLRQYVGVRTDAENDAQRRELEDWLGRHPEPQRFLPPHQFRSVPYAQGLH